MNKDNGIKNHVHENHKIDKKKSTSAAVKNYLILYNTVQTIGWTYLLYLFVTCYLDSETKHSTQLYDHLKWPLIIFQNAAILEVIHAFLRFVPSNPIITGLQISSRVMVVCGALMATSAARESLGLPLLLFAWTVTEIIRYSNYALNLINAVPHFLVWLRYSTFIILYPIGVTGELFCLYAAQKEASETNLFTITMPNAYNTIFYYNYFILFFMSLYIPTFPKLYNHMFTLRRKILGPAIMTNGVDKNH